MGAFSVVVCQPFSDPRAGFRASFKCVEVDAFIFQGPPEPLNHAIVNPAGIVTLTRRWTQRSVIVVE